MTQQRYERVGEMFWIEDAELGIKIEDEIDVIEKDHYPSGTLRFEIGRKKDLLHGPSIYYSVAGQILSKTWYVEGKKVGKANRYYPTGQVYSLERYVDGLAHLIQEYYYIDGTLKTSISYKMGKFHGDTKLYWPDGKIKRETSFCEGEKQGGEIFYDEEAKVIAKT